MLAKLRRNGVFELASETRKWQKGCDPRNGNCPSVDNGLSEWSVRSAFRSGIPVRELGENDSWSCTYENGAVFIQAVLGFSPAALNVGPIYLFCVRNPG
jgi:hypothetical protein